MGFDVMLRFAGRQVDLERKFTAAGYEIIVPRGGRETDQFQIALVTPGDDDTFALLADRACERLRAIGPLLEAAASADESCRPVLDFGVNHDHSLFTQNVRFPQTLLRLLAEIGIDLNLSIYH